MAVGLASCGEAVRFGGVGGEGVVGGWVWAVVDSLMWCWNGCEVPDADVALPCHMLMCAFESGALYSPIFGAYLWSSVHLAS